MHPNQGVIVGSDTLSTWVHPVGPSSVKPVDADSSVYATNDAWRMVQGAAGSFRIRWRRNREARTQCGNFLLTLHYHNTEDTTSYNFVINSNAARVNHFQHSWPTEFGRSMTASSPSEGSFPQVPISGWTQRPRQLDAQTEPHQPEIVLPL